MASPHIRLVRRAPDPLGLFVRAGRIGQSDLLNFIASRSPSFTGVVFEATRIRHQKELLSLVLEKKLDAVLDPMTQPMATLGGYVPAMANLPWASARPHALEDFSKASQQRKAAEAIAKFVVEHGFTQVLAPTHLINGPDDPWLDIDVKVAKVLRNVLDELGGKDVLIQYSLALSYESFRTEAKRRGIIAKLPHPACNGVWLNVDGCGCDSSPTALTRYCDAASEFQALEVPIVADHVGSLMGLSLLAFGGVGGIAHGITLAERFNARSWRTIASGRPFGQKIRIYFPQIDLMLSRMDAEKLFEVGGGKMRTVLACRNQGCCRRGIDDMVQFPARHFLYQRAQQVAELGQIPESLRPRQFLEEMIRPASDTAIKVAGMTLPVHLTEKLNRQTRHLNALRVTLGPYANQRRNASFAMHPSTRVARLAAK